MEPRLPEGVHDLTERQREVAHLVAQGLTNAEIGDRLGISLDGAKYHVSEVLTRLNLERREEIAEWVAADRGRRRPGRRWAFAGLVATLVAALLMVAFLGTGGGEAGSPISDVRAAAPAADVEESPTSAVSAAPDSLYQPVAWDHPTHVNRTPPPSLDAAVKERAVHADGWIFEGALPPAFAPAIDDSEVCPAPSEGVSRVRSGDWLLELSATSEDGAPLSNGQRRVALYPIDPALLDDLGYIEAPLRIRAIDARDWRATHLIEVWRPLEDDGAFHFTFESPRSARWMAVVTAGPLWGCFTLDIEADPIRWSAPAAFRSSWFPDPPSDDDGIDDALRDYVADAGPNQSASRVCVVATGQERTRSGEFAMGRLVGFGNHIDDGFSPFRRLSKVIWLPQYQDNLGDLTMRATLAVEGGGESLHTYAFLAEGPSATTAPRFTYVTGPVLPRDGTWHIVAAAAPHNLGCFTLTVGEQHLTQLN